MLFVRMCGDNFCDCCFDLAKVVLQRPAHLGRSGIDCHSIVEHRREQFAEQQRNRIGKEPIQKQDGQLAVEQIEPTMICSDEDAQSLDRGPYACPQHKRQPNEEPQRVA